LLGEAGLSPGEVGVAATREAAATLGLSGGYGRLEAGACTDLVWFAQDPFDGGSGLEVLGIVRRPAR
jgi:imidazolonepropionase-like amidohydrolase